MPDEMKTILAIDSATSVLRVGLSLTSGGVTEAVNSDRYRHAEFIFKLIDEVLKKNGADKTDIDAIVINTGPGSFTGLRVGMASAKALAVALRLPLVGVSVFSAVAPRLVRECGPAAVLVPSRRNEFYFGQIESEDFDDGDISVITGERLRQMTDLPPLLGIDCNPGSLTDINAEIITSFKPGTADLVDVGRIALRKSGGHDIARLEPLYIQDFKTGKIK